MEMIGGGGHAPPHLQGAECVEAFLSPCNVSNLLVNAQACPQA